MKTDILTCKGNTAIYFNGIDDYLDIQKLKYSFKVVKKEEPGININQTLEL